MQIYNVKVTRTIFNRLSRMLSSFFLKETNLNAGVMLLPLTGIMPRKLDAVDVSILKNFIGDTNYTILQIKSNE